MSYFSLNNISVNYGKKPIIQSLSLSLESGTITALLGANGSGKTTLLKAICGILPHQGHCALEQQTLETLSARELAQICSYIPQRSGISIDISVTDVVLMGFNPRLKLLEYPDKTMQAQAMHALDLVGLSAQAEQNYMTLSEGQKQLCILARTFVADGRLLLLDEPESALDFNYRYKMLSILKKWVKDHRRSALIALHDPSLALNYCDNLVLLQNGNVLDILKPESDPLDQMEQSLSRIYGNVNLVSCDDKQGKRHLVMLKEQE